MTKLESGDLWHALCKRYMDRNHNGDFVLRFRFGFDPGLLTKQEWAHFLIVYRTTMLARGVSAEKIRKVGTHV